MGDLTNAELIFILLLQIIIILSGILGYTFFKINKLKKTTNIKTASTPEGSTQSRPLLEYLEIEAENTRKQLEYINNNEPDENKTGLNLRLNVLEFEIQLLTASTNNTTSGSSTNWNDINQRMYKIHNASGFAKTGSHLKDSISNEEDDTVPSESLLERQNKTIEHLKTFINDLLIKMNSNALPNSELDKHFYDLEQSKIELEQCVMILEDENMFLRDQISALLRVQDASEDTPQKEQA